MTLSMEELFLEYKNGKTTEIRDVLVEKHLYLAESLARKYTGRGVEYDDLNQVAAYALILAVERYDPDKSARFTTYAIPTITGEIKKYFRDKMWSLKVPRRLKENSTKVFKANKQLLVEKGRAPTTKELGEYLNMPENDILKALESMQAYAAYSLDQETDPYGEGLRIEQYLGEEERGYDTVEISGVLEKVVERLSQVEKEVIQRRFVQEATQKEVAKALGIGQMTVSRIEKNMIGQFCAEYNRME